jgi:AcrR family transcriptional regulator
MQFNDKQIQIMEAAEALFAERSFSGTSVRDIAEAAGVNLAMISYYFGSKEKLMEALFNYRGIGYKLQLQNIIQNGSLSSSQKVEKLIEEYVGRIFQKQNFHKIMVREQMTNRNGPVSKLIYELKSGNQALITQLIQEGQKNGEFKKNVDISFLMMTLVGTVSQLMTARHFYRKMNNLESLSEEEFEKHIKKKLSAYLKTLFKAMLDYEG